MGLGVWGAPASPSAQGSYNSPREYRKMRQEPAPGPPALQTGTAHRGLDAPHLPSRKPGAPVACRVLPRGWALHRAHWQGPGGVAHHLSAMAPEEYCWSSAWGEQPASRHGEANTDSGEPPVRAPAGQCQARPDPLSMGGWTGKWERPGPW